MKQAKEELATIIDRSEQEKNAILKEIKNLWEAEEQLNQAKEREWKNFMDA